MSSAQLFKIYVPKGLIPFKGGGTLVDTAIYNFDQNDEALDGKQQPRLWLWLFAKCVPNKGNCRKYQEVNQKHYLQQTLRMELFNTERTVCVQSLILYMYKTLTFLLQIQAVQKSLTTGPVMDTN